VNDINIYIYIYIYIYMYIYIYHMYMHVCARMGVCACMCFFSNNHRLIRFMCVCVVDNLRLIRTISYIKLST